MIRQLIEELQRLPDFAPEIVYHRPLPPQLPRYQEPLRPLPRGLPLLHPFPQMWLGQPPPRVLYFDLETQRSAEEVGGWENRHLMRLACAVIYDDLEQRFRIFREEEANRLVETLAGADLVVGFNLIRFDYGVLRGYTSFDLSWLKTFDLLVDIQQRLGFRLLCN